jgi:predicted nucleotidyltransferase
MYNQKEKIKELVKQSINKFNLNLIELILFGSRARGDYNEFSDYDLLIIIKEDLSYPEKIILSEDIRNQMAKLLIPTDIIIKSKKEVENLKNRIGSIVSYSLYD